MILTNEKLKERILVVDDELEIAQMVQSRLVADGYEVSLAHSGEDGLKKIEQEKFDLIVLDVMMPGLSGYEVCAKIKSNKKQMLPVIMLTSRNKMIDERLGFLCKADAYVRNPMSGQLLLPEIKKLIKVFKIKKMERKVQDG